MAIFYYPKRIPRLRTDAHNKLIRSSKRHILHTAVDLYLIAETGSRDSQSPTLRLTKTARNSLTAAFPKTEQKHTVNNLHGKILHVVFHSNIKC